MGVRPAAVERSPWLRALGSTSALAVVAARWGLRQLGRVRLRRGSEATPERFGPVPRRAGEALDWERLFAAARPAVVTGVVGRWPLSDECTPDGLRRALADTWVSALVSTAGSRDFGRAWLSRSRVRMPAAALIDEVFAAPPGDVRYYAWSVPLEPFAGTFERAPAIGRRHFVASASSLWIGQAGNRTSLHYDHWHGLLGQLVGRKRVVLFAPRETPNLYARSPRSPAAASTRLPADCLEAAPSAFPRFARTPGLIVTLEPGDLLYLPPFWWHQAECLDAAVSITLRYEPTAREARNASSLPRRLRRATDDLSALRAHLRGVGRHRAPVTPRV